MSVCAEVNRGRAQGRQECRPSIYVDEWRRRKCAAFDLRGNSTARDVIEFELWGAPVRIYANANLSIYSGQACNAKCPFCVEELRPASRGKNLAMQKSVERDDEIYFRKLGEVLRALKPLNPSASVTGGEPSKDPRLPAILRTLAEHAARKRTMTTNGSGLFDVREGRTVLDWIVATGLKHLNISRAHPDCARNTQLMALREGISDAQLQDAAALARAGGVRTRLSCVLLRDAIGNLNGILRYLDFAERMSVDNVIFRQLMKTDPTTVEPNFVTRFSDAQRVALEPILDEISGDARFEFQRQIVGYYYYVEVWRYGGIDVVFEEADLAQLERSKRADPGVIHELVFHPNGALASTWQPWDGVIANGEKDGLGSPSYVD
ncbi:MAG TPA: radical SAM protein [Planctomycetota bacterium]|nr:radical SAM protein [Planctomycetota bacterium]